MTDQPTNLDLDAIEARAAYLDEYATLTDEPLQSTADLLTGTDVPALIDTVRRLRAQNEQLDRALGETIDDRDRLHEVADKLAYAVAPIEVLGEHSSMNCPWTNAFELITPASEVDRLRRERDLAIAHDRQPYPTAWAYEQACKALHAHRERADKAEAAIADARAQALRDAAEICDEAGAVYTSKALNEHADAAYTLMERFQRRAEEAEGAAEAGCTCDPGPHRESDGTYSHWAGCQIAEAQQQADVEPTTAP